MDHFLKELEAYFFRHKIGLFEIGAIIFDIIVLCISENLAVFNTENVYYDFYLLFTRNKNIE